MTEDLLRFKNQQKYLVFDFETADLAISSSVPWQLGYSLHQGKKLISAHDNKIFWRDYKMSDQVAMLNHFDRYSYERDARDPEEVLNEFERFLYDPEYIIISMNGLNFDQFIHNNWRKKLGRKSDYSWIDRHLDILPLFRAINAGAKTVDRDDLVCWQYRHLHNRDRKVKASLSAQLKYFGIEFNEAEKHEACTDVRLTFEVFQKIIWQLDI